MAHEMDLVPRQLIRMLQLGFIDHALSAKTPWICANCMVCSARCPQGVDIAAIMLAVRRTAKKQGLRPVRDADIFDDAFVANIRSFGKSNEAILAARYNLLSGHFMQDVLNAPRMAVRGMIGFKIHSVRDKAAVRRLVDRALSGDAREANNLKAIPSSSHEVRPSDSRETALSDSRAVAPSGSRETASPVVNGSDEGSKQ
jgi:heterodisulfide reductase subunit C